MAEMNELWATWLNCAGLVVIGIGLLVFALAATSTCLCAILCAAQPKHSQRPDETGVDLQRFVTGI
jgi:hypothetical protein